MSELIPNITSDEIDLESDEAGRESEIKREKPPHHGDWIDYKDRSVQSLEVELVVLLLSVLFSLLLSVLLSVLEELLEAVELRESVL